MPIEGRVPPGDATMRGMMMPMESPLYRLQQMVESQGAAMWDGLRLMIADVAEVPQRIDVVALALTGGTDRAALTALGLAFVLVLAVATAAAWGVRRLLRGRLHRLGLLQPASASRLGAAKLEEVLISLAPVAAFLVVAQTLTHGLLLHRTLPLFGVPGGTPVFGALAIGIISAIVTGGVAYVVAVQPLSPGRPGLRVLAVSDEQAEWIARTLGRIIAVAIGGWNITVILYTSGAGMGAAHLAALLDGVAVLVLCLEGLWRTRRFVTGFAAYWHKLAVVSVLGLGITWIRWLLLTSAPPLFRVLVTVVVLLGVQAAHGFASLAARQLASHMVRRVARHRTIFVPDAETDRMTAVERPVRPQAVDLRPEMLAAGERFASVLRDAVAWVALIAGAAVLARTWGLHLSDLLGRGDARTWLGMLVDVLLTSLAGVYLWRLFAAGLALMLTRDDGTEQSRSKTVEPLLRAVGIVVIGLGALMLILSNLGISIAPLLASAGVVGIAVGFGAQTLVKDLFSGACYLIEDVFRIGEYIEAATAKGTVEKITFRTVALRHQNGPLHFVPYGSLGTVRNNSRDWVIDKFEIPLPIETDSEQIRRMVKRIGQEMLETDLARHIMAPLKCKLYRIDPGVKLFRCKVQTEPGLQFEVRTEAYRRIELALRDAGLTFATATQNLVVQSLPAALPPSTPSLALAPAAE